jgi:hypothetical protein
LLLPIDRFPQLATRGTRQRARQAWRIRLYLPAVLAVGCREIIDDAYECGRHNGSEMLLHHVDFTERYGEILVSSANFSKAGQERNIEVGLKIQSPWLAQRLVRHFELLREHDLAVRAF